MAYLFKTYFKKFAALFLLCFVLTSIRVLCELEVPNLMSRIVDVGIVNGDVPFVLETGGLMLLWAMGSLVADILNALCASRTSMGFGRDIRSALYKRISAFSLSEIDEFGTSSLITRTTNDVQQLERFVQMSMTIALMSPIMLVGAAIAAWNKNSQLALIVFAAIPVLVIVALAIMRFVMPLMRALQKLIDNLNRVTREGLTGIRVIRAYRREAYEAQRFARANGELAETNVKMMRRLMLLMPLITLILNVATVAIVWAGAQLIDAGEFQVGNLMAIVQYAVQVLISVMMLSSIFMVWPRASAAAERIHAVLKCAPVVTDAPDAVEFELEDGEHAHEVRFEDVEFRFPGAEEPTLTCIDLLLEPGKRYALIGATGSGKTTLVNLLLRFYDPTRGRILIDGVDISQMRQESLRRMLSYVPQRTTLFTGSIRDNIAYGREDASDDDIARAARAAAAHDFIVAKQDGYDTQVTQAGGGLSGGQKQRVAIARALVKESGLYIFDDSFSALDFKTDAQVRRNLKEATSGATVLVIAQRVSVAMDADVVIVLDEGRIVGQGTHDELLKTNEVYREIVASQLSEEEVN